MWDCRKVESPLKFLITLPNENNNLIPFERVEDYKAVNYRR